jgi:2-polyprenyl-3-methyl-5-hydroxy-6-metoxy-1,4-benzoquinol methylase
MTDLIEKLAAKSGIDLETSNALEVGCGYGALSFSLAQKRVRSVIGVDHSMDKVEYARSMLEESASSSYSLRADGDVVETKQINSFAVNSAKNMLSFRCSDPMSLPADFQNFDIVFLNDVIDKVSSPNAVLGRLSGVRGLIKPGGLLGITSCFEWNQQTTPRSLWLGGTSGARESEEELMNRLSADFTLQHSQREPFFWHESERDVRGRLFSVLFFVRK